MEKTAAMHLLEAAGIAYTPHAWLSGQATSGSEVAALLGKDPQTVFKTLVTTGKSGKHYVFMLPVASELDLKKAAIAAGEKSIEMLPAKELLPLTGYVHGGCSPIGMRKSFPIFIDEIATILESITFSAGKIGMQIEMPLTELQKLLTITPADLSLL